ncbi:MAG: adenylate/guanylate cyclase domain-containing protein, partial [Hyphomicrobium sp.]
MKRKIAAILAADVAGYSRLVAEDEEQTLTRLRAYQAVFADVISHAGGRVFKTAGDSVLAEFPSAVDALRCAINVQETLRVRNQAYPMSRQMAYRIGLTIGDVVDQDGDLLGDGVNIAARLESLAQPGGICISKAMHDAVSSKLSVKYIDMGSHQVKNIPIPVHVFSVTPDARPASTGDHEIDSQPANRASWQPPLAVSALAVAIISAALAYTVPQLFKAQPKPTTTTAVTAAPAPVPAIKAPSPTVDTAPPA